MTVTYEWVIEETDPTHEVIIDVNHAPTYGEALAFAKQLKHCDLALVRDHETIHGVEVVGLRREQPPPVPRRLRQSSRSPTDTASSSIRATCSRPANSQARSRLFLFLSPQISGKVPLSKGADR
jgi:hypothetical protein